MYSPRFQLRSFETLDDVSKIKVLEQLLEALTAANEAYLSKHPETPWLYSSGVRYVAEPRGTENWQDIPECLRLRTGDCEDLACWRVAELRVRNLERARHHVKRSVIGGTILYHISVLRLDGRWEDPSHRLGMRRGADVMPLLRG